MVYINNIIMKKILINNININDLKKNIISILKNSFPFYTKIENILLSDNHLYKYKKNDLFKYSLSNELINETEEFTEILDVEKKLYKVMQIPIKHILISKKCIIFKINNQSSLAFELINEKIHDFYITTTMKLNIHDYIFKKELSYIKNLLM